jgi:hypothetical protein
MNMIIEFCVVEKQGGLFDFGPTLPLLAIQLLFLACILAIAFLKPLSLRLSERAQALDDMKYLLKFYSGAAKQASMDAQTKREVYLTLIEKLYDKHKKTVGKLTSEVDIWSNQSIQTKSRVFLSARYKSGGTRKQFKQDVLRLFKLCVKYM